MEGLLGGGEGKHTKLDIKLAWCGGGPGEELGGDVHARGAGVWWEEGEEEAGGFGAGGEGIEGGLDFGYEAGYHFGGWGTGFFEGGK